MFISLMLGIGQTTRVIRFRQRLCRAVPAPDELVAETEEISQQLDVHAPELLVISDLGTPMLWCLGRPQLLLPERLVKTIPLERWRAILTHELAHLRRRDHWVSWLELIAGLIWWWNPLYWLTRNRLDAEAELACDAWVVWAHPKDRLAYAEVLFDICSALSLVKPVPPALGIASSGRFFERRLMMILHDYVPCRLSPLGFVGACLLVLFALPSWLVAKPDAPSAVDQTATVAIVSSVESGTPLFVARNDDDPEQKTVSRDEDDDSDEDADDDDADGDDDDGDKQSSGTKTKSKAPKSKVKKPGSDEHRSKIEKEIESYFSLGSEFEKRMEELGEKIGREIESKFGSGSEFEQKMEDLGKELESKFGSGSDFEKKMKDLGKELESKFGSGSDFEKALKDKLHGDLDAKAKKKSSKEPSSSAVRGAKDQSRPDTERVSRARDRRRARRIAELEAQIRKLASEIKALEAEKEDD
jgi:hypothetical protein